MDFDYSDDQRLLMSSFESLLDRYRKAPEGKHGYHCYSADFQTELMHSGFLDVALQQGYGVLEAALIAEAAAACPIAVEAANSALVGPLLKNRGGPIAIAGGLACPFDTSSKPRPSACSTATMFWSANLLGKSSARWTAWSATPSPVLSHFRPAASG